jgi:Uma2 family endonuclease
MAEVAPVLARERLTYEEFMAFCNEDMKADLIDGVIFLQTPASMAHERLFRFLLQVLAAYVASRGLGEVLGSRTAVRLESGHVYEPDLLFVSHKKVNIIKEQGVDGAPDLVVEILSAGTYFHDTGIKREVYERSGVRELWLIDPYGPEGTEVLRREEESGRFVAIEAEEGVYRSRVIPGLWLREEWLWPEGGRFPDVIEVLRSLGVIV